MTILRERVVWQRKPKARTRRALERLDRLTPGQEANVVLALRVLRVRLGTWDAVARNVQVSVKTVERVLAGRRRPTAGWAVRAATLLVVPVDDVLSGAFPKAGTCPACGR